MKAATLHLFCRNETDTTAATCRNRRELDNQEAGENLYTRKPASPLGGREGVARSRRRHPAGMNVLSTTRGDRRRWAKAAALWANGGPGA
jgi:hypothetical protein